MKKLLLCVAFLGVNLTLVAQTGAYTVRGTIDIPEAEGKMIYLSDYHTNKYTDSARIEGGKFGFNGVVDAPVVRRVDLGRLSSANLVLESGEIQIAMLPNGFVQASPYGTPRNEQLAEFLAETEKLYLTSVQNRKDSTLTPELRKARLDAQRKVVQEQGLALFEANRDNQFGAYMLWGLTQSFSVDQFDSLLQTTGAVVREYGPIARVVKRNERLANTSAGKIFVDFEAKKTDDTTAVKLSDYVGKGKWVLVDFWASWCGPCIAELPNLKAVYAKYKGLGVEVLGINVWDKIDKCNEAIVKHELPWESIVLGDMAVTKTYGIDGIPHLILFAPDGVIAARGLRGEGIGQEIEKQLAAAAAVAPKLLKKPRNRR